MGAVAIEPPASSFPDTLKEQGRQTKPVQVVAAELRAEEGKSVWLSSNKAVGVPDVDAHSCPLGKKLYRASLTSFISSFILNSLRK